MKSETKGDQHDDDDDDNDSNRVSLNSDDDSRASDTASDTSNNMKKVTDFIDSTEPKNDNDDHYYLNDYNGMSNSGTNDHIYSKRASKNAASGSTITNTKSRGSIVTNKKDNTFDSMSDSSDSSSADSYDDRYDIDNGGNMIAMLGINMNSPKNSEIRSPSHHNQ